MGYVLGAVFDTPFDGDRHIVLVEDTTSHGVIPWVYFSLSPQLFAFIILQRRVTGGKDLMLLKSSTDVVEHVLSLSSPHKIDWPAQD